MSNSHKLYVSWTLINVMDNCYMLCRFSLSIIQLLAEVHITVYCVILLGFSISQ